MSKLRERFEEELRLRGYSEVTNRIYVRAVRKFVEFHDRSPRRLGAEDTGTCFGDRDAPFPTGSFPPALPFVAG